MHDRMLDLLRYKATSAETKFLKPIKAPIFLEAVLAIQIISEPKSNLEEKVNSDLKLPNT